MSQSPFDPLLDVLVERIAAKLDERTRSSTVPEWETISACATRLGVSSRSLADAGRAGAFETSRVGHRTLVRGVDVVAWIERRKTIALPTVKPRKDAPQDDPSDAAIAEATRAARANRSGR